MHIAGKAVIALIVAVLVGIGVMVLPLPQNYAEFIVSELSAMQGKKLNDLLVFPVAFLAFVLCYISLDTIKGSSNTKIKGSSNTKWHTITQYINGIHINDTIAVLCVIFACFARALFAKNFLSVLAFLIIIVSAGIMITWYFCKQRKSKITFDEVSLPFLGAIFFTFAPFAIMVAVTRLVPTATILLENISSASIAHGSLLIFVIILIGSFTLSKLSARQIAIGALFAGQACLPLMACIFYPASFLTPEGIFSYNTKVFLPLLLAGLIFAAYADLFWRLRCVVKGQSVHGLLSTLCIAILIGSWALGSTLLPTISVDDYHSAVNLLGLLNYQAGQLPYTDYSLVHGILADDLGILLSYIFYDGTAATEQMGYRLGRFLFLIPCMLLVQWIQRNIVLTAVIGFVSASLWLSYFVFLVPLFVFIFYEPKPNEHARWCLIWLCLALFTVLLCTQAQGVMLATISSLLALAYAIYAYKHEKTSLYRYLTVTILGMGVLLLTPVGDMLISIIIYLYDIGSMNQIAWGIPWINSMPTFDWATLRTQTLRMSWIFFPVLAFLLAYNDRDYYFDQRRRFLPLLVAVLFCFALLPYSLGRIDAGVHSRAFLLTIFTLCFMMPIALWEYKNTLLRISSLCLACFLIFALLPLKEDFTVFRTSIITTDHIMTDGANIGMPRIGRAVTNATHMNMLQRVNAEIVKSGVTKFYNATNFGALHFYTNMPQFVPIVWPNNIPKKSEQLRTIKKLHAANAQLVLLSVSENPFFSILSLRTYYIYRYLLDNYIPYTSQDIIWARPNTEQRPLTPYEVELFARAVSAHDIYRTPASWGASERTLQKELSPNIKIPLTATALHDVQAVGTEYSVEGTTPSMDFSIEAHNISGKDAGILRLELTGLPKGYTGNIHVSWWGDDMTSPDEKYALRFTATNGVQLIPLDSSPHYLTLRHVKGIRLTMTGLQEKQRFSIHDVQLLQRTAIH